MQMNTYKRLERWNSTRGPGIMGDGWEQWCGPSSLRGQWLSRVWMYWAVWKLGECAEFVCVLGKVEGVRKRLWVIVIKGKGHELRMFLAYWRGYKEDRKARTEQMKSDEIKVRDQSMGSGHGQARKRKIDFILNTFDRAGEWSDQICILNTPH